jgi:hypothetical protein
VVAHEFIIGGRVMRGLGPSRARSIPGTRGDDLPVFAEDVVIERPNQGWASDLTYLSSDHPAFL